MKRYYVILGSLANIGDVTVIGVKETITEAEDLVNLLHEEDNDWYYSITSVVDNVDHHQIETQLIKSFI